MSEDSGPGSPAASPSTTPDSISSGEAKPASGTTVADLQPLDDHDFTFRQLKNSPRPLGSWRLALRRPSRMPESSRPYVYGDPVNRIDWKAFARTDQLIIRQERDEAAAQVMVVVEVSPTMFWPRASDREQARELQAAPSKWETAMRVVWHCACQHARLGDFTDVALMVSERGTDRETNGETNSETNIETNSETNNETSDKSREMYSMRLRSPQEGVSAFLALKDLQSSAEVMRVATQLGFVPATQAFENRRDVGYWVGDFLGDFFAHDLIETETDSTGFDSSPAASFARNCRIFALLHTLSAFERSTAWMDGGFCYFDEGSGARNSKQATKKEFLGSTLLRQPILQDAVKLWADALSKAVRSAGGLFLALSEDTLVMDLYGFYTELAEPEPVSVFSAAGPSPSGTSSGSSSGASTS